MSFCHRDSICPVSRSKWLTKQSKQLCKSPQFLLFFRGKFASSAHAAGPVYRDLAITSWISIGDWTSPLQTKQTPSQAQTSRSCHSIFGQFNWPSIENNHERPSFSINLWNKEGYDKTPTEFITQKWSARLGFSWFFSPRVFHDLGLFPTCFPWFGHFPMVFPGFSQPFPPGLVVITCTAESPARP